MDLLSCTPADVKIGITSGRFAHGAPVSDSRVGDNCAVSLTMNFANGPITSATLRLVAFLYMLRLAASPAHNRPRVLIPTHPMIHGCLIMSTIVLFVRVLARRVDRIMAKVVAYRAQVDLAIQHV